MPQGGWGGRPRETQRYVRTWWLRGSTQQPTDEFATRFGSDADWITRRTGVEARRHARPDQATSDLCIEAARKAIRAARVNPTDIDLVVVGTFTPDFSFPSTACIVQDKLDLD